MGEPVISRDFLPLADWLRVVAKMDGSTGKPFADAADTMTALYEALDALFRSYKELADSGDAGFWSLEDQPEGKQAMAALTLALGEAPNA